MKIVKLKDCIACKHHIRIIDNGTVKCGRINDIISLTHYLPSNFNEGFTNDDIIVYCNKEESNV